MCFRSALKPYSLDRAMIAMPAAPSSATRATGTTGASAGVTAISFATFALFTALWSNFVFRNERFRANKLIGLLLGFAGIVVVFFDQLIITHFSSRVIAGSAAVVLGAAGGAMSIVIVKKYLTNINPASLAFNQMLMGFVFLGLIALLFEPRPTTVASLKIWLAILYLGGVGSALAFGFEERFCSSQCGPTAPSPACCARCRTLTSCLTCSRWDLPGTR